MHEMTMPGGWTMSMMWMRMPGQTWPGAAASFLGMWVVMTAAMMLPSLAPALWRYRQAVDRVGAPRAGCLTQLIGAGYFAVWILLGMVVYPVGVALAAIAMRQPSVARAVPMAAGAAILGAGFLQISAWKARRLAFCRESSARGPTLPAQASAAWGHGVCLGLHCVQSCGALMAIALVMGIMDFRAMAVVTAAISIERLAPADKRVARVIGSVVVAVGLFLIATRMAAVS